MEYKEALLSMRVNPLGPGFTPFFAEICNPTTRQAIELESYPNNPRIQQVF